MKRFLFLLGLLLNAVWLPAQDTYRYLELVNDTAKRQEIRQFLTRTLSPHTQVCYLHYAAWGDYFRMWGLQENGHRKQATLYAIKGNGFSAPDSTFRKHKVTVSLSVCQAVQRLFKKAIRLAEDTDFNTMGLDGYTCYFAIPDSAEAFHLTQIWAPLTDSSFCRKLVDWSDSVFQRIMHHETDWEQTEHTANRLWEEIQDDPLPADRFPAWHGIWARGLLTPRETLGDTARFAGYPTIEAYCYDNMIYPEEMLKQGKGGYAFCQLDLDTLGIATNILTIQSSHEAFAEEVTRLLKQMPHALPALDKQGKPVSCTYGIYVQFRPYRYQRRLKEKQEWKARADSMFVDYDSSASFPGGMYKLQQYFKQNLIEVYGQGNASGVRGVYRFKITDYGYPEEVKVLHPGPFPDFDEQVLRFIRKMPRWTPAVDWHASPYTFKDCICTLPVQLPSRQVKK